MAVRPKRHAPKGPIKVREGHPMAPGDPMRGACSARSKQTGNPCKRPAIPGGTVCRYHGGAAPQVKAKALERLQAFQDRAIDRLCALAEDTAFPSTSYAAVRDVLDRTMGKPTEAVTVQHSGGLEIRWAQPHEVRDDH